MTRADWAEAERLWRGAAAMDEKLAMVERALAARAGPGRDRNEEAAAGRDAGRQE